MASRSARSDAVVAIWPPGSTGSRYIRRAQAGSSPTASDEIVVQPTRAGTAKRAGTGNGGARTQRAASTAAEVRRSWGRMPVK